MQDQITILITETTDRPHCVEPRPGEIWLCQGQILAGDIMADGVPQDLLPLVAVCERLRATAYAEEVGSDPGVRAGELGQLARGQVGSVAGSALRLYVAQDDDDTELMIYAPRDYALPLRRALELLAEQDEPDKPVTIKLTDAQLSTLTRGMPALFAYLQALGVTPMMEVSMTYSDAGDEHPLVSVGGTLGSSVQWERVLIDIMSDGTACWCGEQSAAIPQSVHDLFWPSTDKPIDIVFTSSKDVIDANPPGARMHIELTSPERANLLLSFDGLPPMSLAVDKPHAYTLVDEACSVAAALYWSRRRAVEIQPRTWTLIEREAA